MQSEETRTRNNRSMDRKRPAPSGKKRKKNKELQFSYNYSLLLAVLLLCAYGLVIVYSTSSYDCVTASTKAASTTRIVFKQFAMMVGGMCMCFGCQFFDCNILKKIAPYAYLFALALLIALVASPFAVESHGASRWLDIHIIQFQPAEVAKIAEIILIAKILYNSRGNVSIIKTTVICWIVAAFLAGSVFFLSDDLSSALVVAGIAFFMTLIYSGKKGILLHIAALAALAAGVWLVCMYVLNMIDHTEDLTSLGFRYQRIGAWLKPDLFPEVSYQTQNAMYAIGRGGVIGKGLGGSIQKISALPEAQNDMIFAILCEELGLVGAIVLLALYIFLLLQIFRVAIHALNLYETMLVTGVFIHIALQVTGNVAVNLNLMPNTGLTLPFISYGGSAVICLFFEIAMVLSVDRRMRGKKVFDFLAFIKNIRKNRVQPRRRRTYID